MGCLIDTWLIRTVTLRFQIPHVPVQSVTSVASTHMGQSGNSHSLNAVSKDHRYNTRVSTLKFNVAWELLARGSNLFLDSSPQPSPPPRRLGLDATLRATQDYSSLCLREGGSGTPTVRRVQ